MWVLFAANVSGAGLSLAAAGRGVQAIAYNFGVVPAFITKRRSDRRTRTAHSAGG
jgi:hypothetical protein